MEVTIPPHIQHVIAKTAPALGKPVALERMFVLAVPVYISQLSM
jgi:hypothetical protein